MGRAVGRRLGHRRDHFMLSELHIENFTIIDRLQLELADNIERISKDPIYMDSSAQEYTYVNSEINVMVPSGITDGDWVRSSCMCLF